MQHLALLTLGFPLAPYLRYLTCCIHKLAGPFYKRYHIARVVLCVLVNIRFQVLFHSPPGVLFTFPSQYCSTIGHWVVFRLGGWSPHIPYGFHVSVGTLDTDRYLLVSHTRLSLFFAGLPIPFCYDLVMLISVRTPILFPVLVWPLPRSLATTYGISFDFSSSAYLDVSVQRVPFLNLCIQLRIYDSSS